MARPEKSLWWFLFRRLPVPQPNVCTGESIVALQTSGSNSHARGQNTKPNCFSDASNGKKLFGKALIRSLARSVLGRRRYRSMVDPHLGPISSKNRNAKSYLRKLSFLMTKYAYEKTFEVRFIPRDGNQKLPKRNKTAGKTKKHKYSHRVPSFTSLSARTSRPATSLPKPNRARTRTSSPFLRSRTLEMAPSRSNCAVRLHAHANP